MLQLFFLGSFLPVLTASHCDPGFEKERIENSLDYVCKKATTSLSDQDVLDQLAELQEEHAAEEVQNMRFITEEVFITLPDTPVEEAANQEVDDDTADTTTETLPTTSSPSTSYYTSSSAEEAELQNIEEEGGATTRPLFTTSSRTVSTSSNLNKFPARLSSSNFMCKEGYEAHAIEGTEDYACKPKSTLKNQEAVEVNRSSRKLQPAPPQTQSATLETFKCLPGDETNNCCTIEPNIRQLDTADDYFKVYCGDGFALKTFKMVNGKPVLECCRLPTTQ